MSLGALTAVLVLSRVWDVPLQLVAQQADVVGIGTVTADGGVAFETVLKGAPEPLPLVSGTSSWCDVTSNAPGQRGLFFLRRSGGGYRVMHSGRGLLPLNPAGTGVSFFSRRELFVTDGLERRCSGDWCPLDGVLDEIRASLTRQAATAFVVEKRVMRSTRPAAELRCTRDEESHALLCGETGSITPSGHVLCHPIEGRPALLCRSLSL